MDALSLDTEFPTNKSTPGDNKPLIKDEDREGPRGTFSHTNIVGMLLYLSEHSQPTITYTVNYCARYMFSPRLSPNHSLKQIEMYLKATRIRDFISMIRF